MNGNQIKAAQPGDILWDDKVRGLHLRVFAQRRSFYIYFRIKGSGVERRPKIGDYPAFDLVAAREAATRYLRDAAMGIDPIAKRQEEAARAVQVAELCKRYMDKHGSKKKSGADDQRLINTYVLPALGKLFVANVRYADIEDLIDDLADKPVQGNRVRSLLSKMFNLAEKWELRPQNSNPVRHIPRYPEKPRERYMKAEEAVAIAEALEYYKSAYPASVAFIYLLIFTGARKSEIAHARWDWLEGNRLKLPDSKTGAKVIQLPPQVMDILDTLPRTSGTITGIKSPRPTWTKVLKQANVKDLTLHDLRHSYASAGITAGLDLSKIGLLLGHASTQTTKRYAHLVEEVAEAAAAQVADQIEATMKPAKKGVVQN